MTCFELSKKWRAHETPEERRLAYNDRIARLRKSEYPMLKGLTYLDHGGTTLTSKAQLECFATEMQRTLLANPHSDAASPSASSTIVADTRSKVLRFLNADPDYFDVVFTANATAAVKLVMECFSGIESGFDYCYHLNCHTSLVGVRELAKRSRCIATDDQIEEWLDHGHQLFETGDGARTTLFAYPAQSNMNGQRLPLHWPHQLRKSGSHPDTYTLLDAAAFVSTSPLDLSDHMYAPDFTALSFYKIFGFPDLGALIVRKASAHILDHRKYFGGGTTEMTTCLEEKPWVARKEASLHARLEDGTIAIRSLLALRCAFETHGQLFGSMEEISRHTSWLAGWLYKRLGELKHANGIPVCHIYKAASSRYGSSSTQGATIALNVRNSDGSWMGPYAVGSMLKQHNIHVRTGSLCNPAGMACALDLSPTDIRLAYDEGFRCNQQDDIRTGGVLFGMVRVTIGAMNTLSDVEALAQFAQEHLVDRHCSGQSPPIMGVETGTVDEGKRVQMLFEKQEQTPSAEGPKIRGRLTKVWRSFACCLP